MTHGKRERQGRSRSPDRERHRRRDRSREKGSRRSHSRERKRERSRSKERAAVARNDVSEEEKKKQRLAKLAAWKNKQAAAQPSNDKPTEGNQIHEGTVKEQDEAEPKAWMPWEDPTAAFTAAAPQPGPPPRLGKPELPTVAPDNGVDPLDAFMNNEINPEVKAKEDEEAQKREAELMERAKMRAEGKIPQLDKILEEESEEEEQPDAEVQVPEHKVKLVVGPGGEKIKLIQRKSKCRLQIKKSETELQKGFLEKRSYALPKPRKPGDEVKMVTIMMYGNAKECEIATRMIDEAIDNREQKQKQREREYERKRDAKVRERQLYHMRHTRDYEELGIPIGSSKADAKKAYRELAKKWHPDKHPNNVEEAKQKFQAIQKAYDSLMTTDEETRVESLAH